MDVSDAGGDRMGPGRYYRLTPALPMAAFLDAVRNTKVTLEDGKEVHPCTREDMSAIEAMGTTLINRHEEQQLCPRHAFAR